MEVLKPRTLRDKKRQKKVVPLHGRSLSRISVLEQRCEQQFYNMMWFVIWLCF